MSTQSTVTVPLGSWTELDLLSKLEFTLQCRGPGAIKWIVAASAPGSLEAGFAMYANAEPVGARVDSGDKLFVTAISEASAVEVWR